MYDLLFINETKLDESIPSSFAMNFGYQVFRRDRNKRGGGVLLFVKNSIKVVKSYNSLDLELIYLQIDISNEKFNFICIYRPPGSEIESFFEHLEDFVFTLDASLPLFIIGDLNCDLLSDEKSALKEFIDSNCLKNFVQNPTRIVRRFITNLDEYQTTLIDVLIHNSEMVKKTGVFPCSFSDHCIVTAELVLERGKEYNEDIIGRNLSQKNIDKIIEKISMIKFCNLNNFGTTVQQWGYLKSSIMKIIDKIAPLRKINKKSE